MCTCGHYSGTGGLSVYHLEVGLSDLSCVECDSLAF